MNEHKENIVVKKSYAFALEIISLYKFLIDQKEFIISKQLMRSGTSIGANIQEGVSSESKKDFIYKLSISVKEARESLYWLRLLKDSNFISENQYICAMKNCEELIRILSSIILTTKERYFKNIYNS